MRLQGSISRACDFVDFPLVFQRNAILTAHFRNLFNLSPDPSPESHQILSLSMILSLIRSLDLILSLILSLISFSPTAQSSHFVDLLKVFQRISSALNCILFVPFRWFTNGFSTKCDRYKTSFCHVISLIFHWFFNETRFHRPLSHFMIFRWFSIGFSTKSALGGSITSIGWFRWFPNGFSTKSYARFQAPELVDFVV